MFWIEERNLSSTQVASSDEQWICYDCALPPFSDSFSNTSLNTSINASFSESGAFLYSSEESFLSTSSLSSKDEEDYSNAYFSLGLGDKGLRIEHWNVDYLTSAKFDQIKLYLLGDSSSAGKSQLDALFLSETFLKPCVPDSIYAVSGFSICRRERVSKGGGGIVAFVNQDLTVRR